MLALEIVLEKKLGIHAFISSSENIYSYGPGYAPGDFSGLDLSKMNLVRDSSLGHGNFKGWHLTGSNFDGTTFQNILLMGANFENASLKGVDLSKSNEIEEIVLHNANIEGLFAGKGYIPSRHARNHTEISRSTFQLNQFRLSQSLVDIDSRMPMDVSDNEMAEWMSRHCSLRTPTKKRIMYQNNF